MGYKFRAQTSFSAGSLSNLQQGQYDSKTYQNSVAKLENMIPVAEGPAIRRPGTHFASAAATHEADESRLFPFYFGDEQAYILEFYEVELDATEERSIRIYREDDLLKYHASSTLAGQVVTVDTITSSHSDHTNGVHTLIALTGGTGSSVVATVTVASGAISDVTITSGGSAYVVDDTLTIPTTGGIGGTGTETCDVATITSSLANKPVIISDSGYSASQIHEIDAVQSADVLFITHQEHTLKKIERTIPLSTETGYNQRAEDGTYWRIVDADFKDGPWDSFNSDNSKLIKVTSTDPEWIIVDGVGIDTTANKFTIFGHGLRNGMKVRFTTAAYNASTAPTGTTLGNLADGQGTTPVGRPFLSDGSSAAEYYIVNAESSSFSLSGNPGGSPIEFILEASDTVTSWTGHATIEKYVIPFKKTSDGSSTEVTLTAYSDASTTINDFWKTDDLNSQFRVNLYCGADESKTKGVQWAWFKITNVTGIGSGYVKAVPQSQISLFDILTREWAYAALGGRFKNARRCQIHQQRLILASSPLKPTTLWISNTADFENFAPDTAIGVNTGESDSAGQSIVAEQILENNSITLTIDSDTVDHIYWLAEGKKLAIGTSGGVFHLYGSETNRTVSPTNFTIVRDSTWESADIAPVRVGDALIYTQLGKRKIRGMLTEGGNYPTTELSMTTDYFQQYTIKQVVHQKQPYSIIWIVREDGKLVSMSFDEKHEYTGWAIHTIGGSHVDATYGNHAKVESIGVIPKTPDDRVWMIVKRDIDGGEKRYVEFLENFFLNARDTQKKAHYLDSGLQYTHIGEDPIETLSSLDHLEGETISLLVNGGVADDQTVAELTGHTAENPKIGVTFSAPYSGGVSNVDFIAGLKYDSKLHTLPVRMGDDGSIFPLGRVRMIKAHFRFIETLAVQAGVDTLGMEDIVFRATSATSGEATPLFTGTKIVNIIGRTEEEEILKVESSGPLPITILNVITEHEVNL